VTTFVDIIIFFYILYKFVSKTLGLHKILKLFGFPLERRVH